MIMTSNMIGSNILCSQLARSWGISSIGRVRALQARGTGIETPILHILSPGLRRHGIVMNVDERCFIKLEYIVLSWTKVRSAVLSASETRHIKRPHTLEHRKSSFHSQHTIKPQHNVIWPTQLGFTTVTETTPPFLPIHIGPPIHCSPEAWHEQ